MFTFFKKLFSPLSKKIRSLFSQSVDDSTFEHLEQIFYEADLGHQTAFELVEKIKGLYRKTPTIATDEILKFVKQELLKEFKTSQVQKNSPHVILIVGVNGSGKTTSIAKLASHFLKQKQKVLIAAADTFRAAASEQLETWANKVGVDIVKSQTKSCPSGVAFDAIKAAKARNIDVVLIDTAGRLQTKTDLMQELAKIKKVANPDEILLVVDATVGQNAIDQAKMFNQYAPITGIILTKLDGSAKGGIAVAIQKQLSIPICWIGTGETSDDFKPFDAKTYLDELFS